MMYAIVGHSLCARTHYPIHYTTLGRCISLELLDICCCLDSTFVLDIGSRELSFRILQKGQWSGWHGGQMMMRTVCSSIFIIGFIVIIRKRQVRHPERVMRRAVVVVV